MDNSIVRGGVAAWRRCLHWGNNRFGDFARRTTPIQGSLKASPVVRQCHDREAKPGSHLEAEMEHPNILLGDIVTVPFQELYGVLSTLSPQQLNDLATQLKSLPAGKDTNAEGDGLFKAWAHFDPIAALHAAAGIQRFEAKTTAVHRSLPAPMRRRRKHWPRKSRSGRPIRSSGSNETAFQFFAHEMVGPRSNPEPRNSSIQCKWTRCGFIRWRR